MAPSSCLFRSDYGPADPHFDPLAQGGALIKGDEAHAALLARAENLGQLQAMERKLARGQEVAWCDQGYGWVHQPVIEYGFVFALIAIVLPYFLWRANLFRFFPSRLSASSAAKEHHA